MGYESIFTISQLSTFNFNVLEIDDNSPEGYILEVDLDYPITLHDLHKDLPYCAEHNTPPGSTLPKLLTTLYNKRNYIIHYRNLKQALNNGLILRKIHRVLKFSQSAWLKPYIDLNTQLRSKASTSFAKNLFKLMNNAVFGKTMENIRKHRIVKLVNKWDGRYGVKNLISSPSFHSLAIFDEDLVAIEMFKNNITFNKPLYIGMCILDISKTLMYEFHYNYMLTKFPIENCKLMYIDTDSFIYEIKCEDAYREIIKTDIVKFDTSDYPIDNKYEIPLVNKKVLGLMKDEANGQIVTHFVGLRSKMYTFKIQQQNDKYKCIKKAKGIKYNKVKNTITFEDYEDCLKLNTNKFITQRYIHSRNHNVFSCEQTKLALNASDNKRYLLKDCYDTLPWGHYMIPK